MSKILYYPALYKHFKGEVYCTKFISRPAPTTRLYLQFDKINFDESIWARHTETNKVIKIFKLNGVYYHQTELDNQPLVIYNCVNNMEKSEVYARPIHMFLSKVDKIKYPDCEQEYRFEQFNDAYAYVMED